MYLTLLPITDALELDLTFETLRQLLGQPLYQALHTPKKGFDVVKYIFTVIRVSIPV